MLSIYFFLSSSEVNTRKRFKLTIKQIVTYYDVDFASHASCKFSLLLAIVLICKQNLVKELPYTFVIYPSTFHRQTFSHVINLSSFALEINVYILHTTFKSPCVMGFCFARLTHSQWSPPLTMVDNTKMASYNNKILSISGLIHV